MILNTTKIELIMAEREMSKTELAQLIGMANQNLSTLLARGTCYPKTVGRLAKAMGVAPAEIIKGK